MFVTFHFISLFSNNTLQRLILCNQTTQLDNKLFIFILSINQLIVKTNRVIQIFKQTIQALLLFHQTLRARHKVKKCARVFKMKKSKATCMRNKIKNVMHEFKYKALRSGKSKMKVKKRKQAIAIALSVANKKCARNKLTIFYFFTILIKQPLITCQASFQLSNLKHQTHQLSTQSSLIHFHRFNTTLQIHAIITIMLRNIHNKRRSQFVFIYTFTDQGQKSMQNTIDFNGCKSE